MAESWGESPIHPIIERPHEYDIVRLDYQCDREDFQNSYLDLWLRRETIVRHLRFKRPRSLKIEEGFHSTGGMIILDVRNRQWDDVGVEVADFEASQGAITFCAAEVIDMDKPTG